MKSSQTILRLRRFEVEEKRQKINDIQAMTGDFERMAEDLDRQIELEQKRSGITDVNHFNYPTFAKAAIKRRENLLESISGLNAQLESAHEELAAAQEEFDKLQAACVVEKKEISRRPAQKVRKMPAVAPIEPLAMSAGRV